VHRGNRRAFLHRNERKDLRIQVRHPPGWTVVKLDTWIDPGQQEETEPKPANASGRSATHYTDNMQIDQYHLVVHLRSGSTATNTAVPRSTPEKHTATGSAHPQSAYTHEHSTHPELWLHLCYR
jgi:hypothetical protein